MMPENNQRLLQAIRVGNIGIFEHNHETDLIHWSLELRTIYGRDSDEPVTLPQILAHVYPDERAECSRPSAAHTTPTATGRSTSNTASSIGKAPSVGCSRARKRTSKRATATNARTARSAPSKT